MYKQIELPFFPIIPKIYSPSKGANFEAHLLQHLPHLWGKP